jgi:putative transposase
VTYVKQEFDVIYKSKQSYYELFARTNISWKKTQKVNLKSDEKLVKKSGKKLTRFYLKTRLA